jgi:PQQ enzyme-like repeat protein
VKALLSFALVAGTLALALPARAGVDNLTYHGDTMRTGWNAQETVLTPAAVARGLKRKFNVSLDGDVFGQPLIATGEQTAGGMHDLAIVATMKDVVYALDAATGAVVWSAKLSGHGYKPVPAGVTACPIAPTYGIVSTPVIDRSSDTLWTVAAVYGGKPQKAMHYFLHALSLSSGADKRAAVEIGGATGGPSGQENFIPVVQTQRPALVENNGTIYIAFGSTCDFNPTLYHGWVFAYNAATLAQTGIYNTTPNPAGGEYLGGIWMNGDGPVVDPLDGSLLFATGNGTFDGTGSFGDSVVRVSSNLSSVIDYFTPYTVNSDNNSDADLGAGGMMLLPDDAGSMLHMATVQGKDGILTLMNRENLGKYTPGGPDDVLAELSLGGVWSSPAYWSDGNGGDYVFTTGGPMYEVQVSRTPPSLAVVGQTNEYFPQNNGNGATPTVSSNGNDPSSGIVWIVLTAYGSPEAMTLYAYAITNLAVPLAHVPLGNWTLANSYRVPTVANGIVYVPGEHSLMAYGSRK